MQRGGRKVTYGVIVPVGPGREEKDRVSDLLNSLFHYEPHGGRILLVDDDLDGPRSFNVCVPKDCGLHVIGNPRKDRGDGWTGGLCVAVCSALKWFVEQQEEYDFYLRLDTDSLVINTFKQEIRSQFQRVPKSGILGTFSRYPDGKKRLPHDYSHTTVKRLVKRVTKWVDISREKGIDIKVSSKDRLIRNIVKKAIYNGYTPGFYVQGGGYAVKSNLAESLYSEVLKEPLNFVSLPFGEDVWMTILAYYEEFEVNNFNQRGEPFGVQDSKIPGSCSQMIKEGRSILHSVRDGPNQEEEQVREYFQNQRQKK